MRKIGENCLVFGIGGMGYVLIELLWRGYSHWTMALTGGMCFLLIYRTDIAFPEAVMWKKCLAGSLIITELELTVGFLVNLLLRWNVWDYTNQPFNLFGQVCPVYSGLWFLLCIPLSYLCAGLKRWLERLFGTLDTAAADDASALF